MTPRARKLQPKYKPPNPVAATDAIEGKEIGEAQVVSVSSGKCYAVNPQVCYSAALNFP